MSDYIKKRIDYINKWPNVVPFEAEINYKNRCDQFIETHTRQPFSLIKLWEDNNDHYNRAISHFIDSLDVMPFHPNFAFSFVFSALDFYSKSVYSSSNITICFKTLAEDISDLADHDTNINDLLKLLFTVIPVSSTMYLYKCLCGLKPENKAYNRVTTNIDNRDNITRKNLVDSIYTKYGDSTANRNPALLYRKVFINSSISVNGTTFNITNSVRLHLLISGIIYSLRNDSLHGSSMSSTKSSQTTPKRYALNYYCYLATYTLLMILLIKHSSMSFPDKITKYAELKDVTTMNVNDFRNLFGNHIQ